MINQIGRLMKKIILPLFFLLGCDNNLITNKNGLKTQNVILITLDGVRWQEVFQGADKRIINNIKDDTKKELTLKSFWVNNEMERRNLLMPFMWNTIALKGQLYGNKTKGSVMQVTNPYFFSYPGYNELLVGFNDDSVKSNSKIYNPNVNILEFMNSKEGFKGRVAAFASWDVFDWIINKERNDFTINSGAFPLTDSLLTKKQRWMNNFISDLPYEGYGTGVRWDALTHEYAFEYLKLNKPRLLYIAYDESDEYAHQKKYGEYLSIINRLDKYISSIWEWTQSQDMYKNNTTLIINTTIDLIFIIYFILVISYLPSFI